MKALVRDPAPFVSSPDVIGFACVLDYGNPSTQSAYALACFPGFTYLCLVYSKKYIKLVAIPLTLGAILMSVMVPYSCYYLGLNSIDQILTGGLIGLNTFLFMVTSWHQHLRDHLEQILEGKNMV